MRAVRTMFAALSVVMMLVVGAASMSALVQPPPPCDPEEGDCTHWGMVCCGSQCWIGGEQGDYCLYEGPYTCCK